MSVSTVEGMGAGGELRIGDVFEQSFALLKRNWIPYLGLTAVAALPLLWSYLQMGSQMTALMQAFSPRVGTPVMTHNMQPANGYTILTQLGTVLQLFVQVVITCAAVFELRGQKESLGEAAKLVLSRIFPLIGMGIIGFLAFGLGLLVFIIPGIILLVRWYLSVPACILERRGPLDSLKRSANLTAGDRWKIFGVLLLFALGSLLVVAVVMGVLGAAGGMTAALMGNFVWRIPASTFGAVMIAVMYHNLRVAKEGMDTDQIADVFA